MIAATRVLPPCVFLSVRPLLIWTGLRLSAYEPPQQTLNRFGTYQDELLLFVFGIPKSEPQRPDVNQGALPVRIAVTSRQWQRKVQQLQESDGR